jgi:hypothetical protein
MTGLSFIGILLLGYLTSTRFDGILYARTVNGIRKYFYDRSPISFSEELQIRALPRNINVPKYIDQKYFSYVVLTFMLVGTTYFGVGWYAFWEQPDQQHWSFLRLIVVIIVFASLHWLVYLSIANYRERALLQRPIIGVDIDGVLNSHRQQFCSVLQQTVNKQLLPESIVRIPVHEIEAAGVLRVMNMLYSTGPDTGQRCQSWTTGSLASYENCNTCLVSKSGSSRTGPGRSHRVFRMARSRSTGQPGGRHQHGRLSRVGRMASTVGWRAKASQAFSIGV